MRNALSIAARLLPDGDVHSAAFGVFEEASGSAVSLGRRFRLDRMRTDPECIEAISDPGAASILAVGYEEALLIHAGNEPEVDAFAIYDISAEVESKTERPSVRLKPNSVLADQLDETLQARFTLGENPPWNPEGLAGNVAAAINLTGDPLKSRHTLLRFIARSIRAIQTGRPAYIPKIVPDGIRFSLRHSSVNTAIREAIEQPGWIQTLIRAFEADPPDQEEIFLLIAPGEWILTDRRLCLLGDLARPKSVRLREVKSYTLRGLFTRSMDLRLVGGAGVRWAGSNLISEGDFDRYLAILRDPEVVGAA